MIHGDFLSIKAAQAAGYLLKKANNRMDYYVLTKILYLAERNALISWNFVMFGGRLASMPYGPVHSDILNYTKHEDTTAKYWMDHINKPNDENVIYLKKEIETSELSKREKKLLDDLFDQFGKYTFADMKDYTHKLPEFTDPGSTSLSISHDEILLKTGINMVVINHIREMTILRDEMREIGSNEC